MTKYNIKTSFGKANSNFMFDKEACQQCKARDEKWIWIGCTLKGKNECTEWRRAEANSMNEPPCLSKDMALLSGIEMPKHISKLPSWVLQLYGLETLSLSCCCNIKSLPLEDLIKFPFLRSLDLTGCGKLLSPPQEICSQGGKATLQFLRDVKKTGKFNEIMNLILVGDAEAGKTSVIMALKSKVNCAVYIRADHRTVGIDITTWQSERTVFRVYDFAGQLVYAKTHQHFLLRRAVYLFVWRALPGLMSFENIEKSIKFWLESLQNRMPGSFVVMVVTHVDQVDSVMLKRQIGFVQATVCEWLSQWSSRSLQVAGSDCDINLPVLNVWNQGNSIPVNCLSGEGVSVLKEAVQTFSAEMPWYREALPSQWIALQESLELQRVRHRYISWSFYCSLAGKAGMTGDSLIMATKYFCEVGVIQYFGDYGLAEAAGRKSSDLMNDFVFICCTWMIDVMKGLLCHERQALMDFLLSRQDKEMLLHLNTFNRYGILNKCLIPYLWPSRTQCPEFWGFLCRNKKREIELWKQDTISNKDDLACALALLVGFDQAAEQGDSYLVPGALAPAQFPSTPSVDVDVCPYRIRYQYLALPPGALDSIFIRTAKNGYKCAQITPFLAVFYDESGNICQIFCFREQGATDIENLVLRSSSNQILAQVEKEVLRMESKFCGLMRRHRSEREHNLLGAPKVFVWNVGERMFSSSPEIVCGSCVSSHQRNVHVFNKNTFAKDWFQIFCEGSSSTQETECPVCHNTILLLDLLTTCRISDSERRLCPCCEHFGNDTDTFFSAGECRLQLNLISHPERAEKTITCFVCMHQGRIGQIRISDLVQEEVFVSGLSTFNKKLQCSVQNLMQQIELVADVGCCERLDSLKGSLVVVVLLSDAYLHSEQCRQEFISAFRSRQALIPILMPDDGTRNEQGVSFGWTGSADGEYWRHAVDMMANSEQSVDWSLLRHFAPLQFPLALNSDQPLMQECKELARLVAAKVKSRIQRDGKTNNYSEMSILGVRLSYFRKFIKKHGGESSFIGLNTEQVVHQFVKPATEQTRLSLCELLMSQGLDSEVGRSEWFYSHASKCLFLETVSALYSHFEGSGADPVIWFDAFSVSHHKTESKPFEWWNTVFLSAIGSIGKILLLVQPYEDPQSGTPAWISLRRLWCVFEIYAGAATSCLFEVTMTKEMSTKFLADLDADAASVLSLLQSFDCANCVASSKEDEEQVFDVITKSTGFPVLNSIVMSVVEQWLYEVLLSRQKYGAYGQLQGGCRPALDIMEAICSSCLRVREQRLGADHQDTTNSKRILQIIQRAQTDSDFLGILIEQGWKAHELEEFQREQQAKTVDEERQQQQKADIIARLVAEELEEKERKAAEDAAKRKREIEEEATRRQKAEEEKRCKAAEDAAKAEKHKTEERPNALQAAQAAEKFKCCSIA